MGGVSTVGVPVHGVCLKEVRMVTGDTATRKISPIAALIGCITGDKAEDVGGYESPSTDGGRDVVRQALFVQEWGGRWFVLLGLTWGVESFETLLLIRMQVVKVTSHMYRVSIIQVVLAV